MSAKADQLATERGIEEEEEPSSVNDGGYDSDDDDAGDLILLAKYSNVKLKGEAQNRAVQQQQQQKRKQTDQEKALAAKKEQKKAEARQKSERVKLSKADKRLAFSLEALRVADSHVPGTTNTVSTTNAASKVANPAADTVTVQGDVKQLLAEGLRLSQAKKSKEAIPVLKQAMQSALAQGNLATALSSCTLLGNEHLALEQTRDAIDCFHRAIALAKQVGVTIEQRQSLIGALQNAYKNVGDSESAAEVLHMYGPAFFASEPTPVVAGAPVDKKPQELTDQLKAAVNEALEQGLLKKDLQPLKTLIASFVKTPFITSVVRHAHPQTGVTCLHVAAGRDDDDLVRSALALGANLGAKDASGASPLLLAARFGGVKAMDALIKGGAKFDEDLTEKEIASWSPAVKQRVAAMVSG